MTPNVPEVQVLFDTGDKTVVKVVGYFTAATNTNTKIVQANTLNYANSSSPVGCILSCTTVQYAAGFANGYCSIQWAGNSAASVSNNDMLIMGGKTSSQFVAYMPNPLASNVQQLPGGSGDLNLFVEGAEPFDSFSLIITLIKEGGAGGGYSNVYAQYNAPWFGLSAQPA